MHVIMIVAKYVTTPPYLWWRFIDDIFTIWQYDLERLENFLQINSFQHTIKFTAEISMEQESFLDTTVILDGTTIQMELYTKLTDTHQYLYPDSCHPRHCTVSIPYSQRLCSKNENYTRQTAELKTHLLVCGYQETAVDLKILRATNTPCQ